MGRHASLLSRESWDEPALREQLAIQFAETLKVDRTAIDPAKSFDEYGLDSVDAVIATESLGKRLGIELPPEFLFENRSVDEVVQALLGRECSEGLRASRDAVEGSIFLFPGGAGVGSGFVRFCAQCAPTLALEVIRIGGWRDWIKRGLDFDGLVDLACQHIEAVGTDTPMRLVGHSQGGQLAYASALRLVCAGRQVMFVGLFDSNLDSTGPQTFAKTTVAGSALHYASRYIGARARGRKDLYPSGDTRIRVTRRLLRLCSGPAEQRKLLTVIERFGGVLFRGSGGIALENYIQSQLFSRMWDAWLAKNGAAYPLDSPVFLFRSGEAGPADLGWRARCSDLRIVPVLGGHITMFDAEHVGDLISHFIAAVRSVV
jgi:thioesterase domain-containing protein/acyl carrier protein